MNKKQNLLEFIVVCSYGSSCLPKEIQEASKKNLKEYCYVTGLAKQLKNEGNSHTI